VATADKQDFSKGRKKQNKTKVKATRSTQKQSGQRYTAAETEATGHSLQ
tara:strand:- start:17 stop:163 length:147 start_codon:yes stop_codon:yes gene_type:complete